MTIIDASLLITTGFFAVYGLSCALECGIGIGLLITDSSRLRTLFNPFWEVTNVFLVFGFTALAVLFNGALKDISHSLLSTLAVALFALLLRGCVVLKIFYVDQGKIGRVSTGLFALCNFAIPLSFSAAGIYLATGHYFWQSWAGGLMLLAAAVGLAAIGLSYISLISRNTAASANLLLVTWLLILGSILPLSIAHTVNHLNSWPVATLSGLSLAALLSVGLNQLLDFKKIMLALIIVTGLAAPLSIAWANRPYLISGRLTLAQAYGAQAFGSVVVIGLVITLPLSLVGFWLFYKLLAGQKSHPDTKQ